jgi:hypothetical protein
MHAKDTVDTINTITTHYSHYTHYTLYTTHTIHTLHTINTTHYTLLTQRYTALAEPQGQHQTGQIRQNFGEEGLHLYRDAVQKPAYRI